MAAKRGYTRPLMVVIPTLLSLVGFVLAMIALFAGSGSQQRSMENYHIIAINMSTFGHDLVPTPSSSASQPTATSGDGFGWDDIQDGLDDIESQIIDELNDIANDIADQLSRELGISQWYSIHVMTACEGNFAPNATSPGAWYNTTNCTAQSAGVQFNLTDIIQKEINAGPLNINAADIPIPDSIQQTLDYVNKFLLATFILYVLGAGFSGLSFISCIIVLTLRREAIGRGAILVNMVLSALAALSLAVGAAIATAISKRGASEINDRGGAYGISAVEGTKFMIVSWVAFAVMFVTLAFWAVSCCTPRRKSGSSTASKEKAPRTSTDSNRGLLGLFRRRH
ncbi:actin cortical patch SUR7/pH-response regulator pali [Daldinia decipiens]|uniref:actin cortical patch SUR7/pH-response regulator pali n=1 Tax=Daldinia decipiens TaxID=326647 RepID=UPI0020C4145B|nr:actin cortical patch SUR7/pH-response regulator pali [Daldinia decipiens]KAI1656690.1 actin cortical patch SUR7/pH-response regulator pali [Daldinia decipiens]